MGKNRLRDTSDQVEKVDVVAPFVPGANYFLGIAIDKYKYKKELKNCVRDVTAIRDELVKHYEFDADNTRLITDATATRRMILKELADLYTKVGEHDSIVFMFSGHGENVQGRNIGSLIPVDARDEFDYLDLSSIKAQLDSFKCRHIFVVFDSCFSGLIFTQRSDPSRNANIPDNFPSRFALTSGRNSPVDDGKALNSPFAAAILTKLRDNDDKLGSIALSQYILDFFSSRGTDKEQLPDFGPINNDPEYRGQFYFYPKNYAESLARERTKRLEAEDARKVAQEALVEVEKQRSKAEQIARTAFANGLAFKSKIALRDGDRTTAFRLAAFADRYVDPHNFKVQEAFIEAFYHNDNPNVVWLPWAMQSFELKNSRIVEVKYTPDGQYLAIATNKNQAKLWHLPTGQVQTIDVAQQSKITSLDFSPDGSTLALGLNTASVLLWNIREGKVVAVLNGHKSYIASVTFSPTGSKLASTSADKTAKIWDVAKGLCLQTLQGHNSEVSAAIFSHDEKKLLTASFDGNALVWDIDTGEISLKLIGHTDSITSAVFSKNGSKIITGSFDATAIVWDGTEGTPLQVLRGHEGKIWNIALAADGNTLATASQDQTVIVWSRSDDGQFKPLTHLRGHTDSVGSVAFSPIKNEIATGSSDNTAKIWNLNKEKEAITFSGHTDEVRCVDFFASGKMLATASEDKTVKIWDAGSGDVLKTLSWHLMGLRSFAIAPKGDLLVAVSSDKNISIWDTSTWELRKTIESHASIVRSVCFSPDGKRFATGSADQTVKLWDAQTFEPIHTLDSLGASVLSVAFSADNHTLLVGLEDGSVRLWDDQSPGALTTIPLHSNIVRSVHFSPDGTLFATSSDDRTSKICDVASGRVCFTLEGHDINVFYNAFSPDGKILATASYDRTVKFWDAKTGKLMMTLEGHKKPVLGLAFSKDGSQLATCSQDNTVILWQLDIAACVRNILAKHPVAALNLSQLQAHELDQLLDQFPDNEARLIDTHETWQIATFADLYTEKVKQTGFPLQQDYDRAVRLYQACLSHHVDNAYFTQKIAVLKTLWAERNMAQPLQGVAE